MRSCGDMSYDNAIDRHRRTCIMEQIMMARHLLADVYGMSKSVFLSIVQMRRVPKSQDLCFHKA